MELFKIKLAYIAALICFGMVAQFPASFILKEYDVAWAETYWSNITNNQRWITVNVD